MHQNTDGIWSFDDKGKATKRLAQRDGEFLDDSEVHTTHWRPDWRQRHCTTGEQQAKAEGGFIKDPWESHDSV